MHSWRFAAPTPVSPKSEGRGLEDVERQHIVAVLEETSWRVIGDRGAATILGLKRTTLEARMQNSRSSALPDRRRAAFAAWQPGGIFPTGRQACPHALR